jgi:hypothetical protein
MHGQGVAVLKWVVLRACGCVLRGQPIETGPKRALSKHSQSPTPYPGATGIEASSQL